MTISKRAMKGLEGSIKKWEKIVDGSGEDSNNCPLCKLYYRENCRACPISKDGATCLDAENAYDKWENHQEISHLSEETYKVHSDCCLPFAKAELAYLKGLKGRVEKKATP